MFYHINLSYHQANSHNRDYIMLSHTEVNICMIIVVIEA